MDDGLILEGVGAVLIEYRRSNNLHRDLHREAKRGNTPPCQKNCK
jgi:hypothetical protein